MVAKESKKKAVETKDKKVKPTKEEEDVPETETAVTPKQDKKKKEKKEKKDKKAKKADSDAEVEEKPVEKKDKKKKEKKEKKPKKEEKKVEPEEEKEDSEDNKRKRDDEEEEAEAEVEEPVKKAAKSASGALPPVVYVSRLSYSITEEELKEFLADCGEIETLEWINDNSQKFCGAAVVTFTDFSSVAKAVAKSGQEVTGRPVDIAGHKEVLADSKTLFIGGLPKQLDEEDFKSHILNLGITPTAFRFPTDKMSGEYKGICFAEFETPEQAAEAYNSKIHSAGYYGRALRLDFSAGQKEGGAGGFGGNGGGRGGRGGFGGGRGGRGGGGFGGGRGGGFGGGRGGGFGGGRGGRGGGFGGRGGGGAGGKRTTFDE